MCNLRSIGLTWNISGHHDVVDRTTMAGRAVGLILFWTPSFQRVQAVAPRDQEKILRHHEVTEEGPQRYAHTHAHALTPTHANTNKQTHTHTHTHTHTRTARHTDMHARTHRYTDAHTRVCIHTVLLKEPGKKEGQNTEKNLQKEQNHIFRNPYFDFDKNAAQVHTSTYRWTPPMKNGGQEWRVLSPSKGDTLYNRSLPIRPQIFCAVM